MVAEEAERLVMLGTGNTVKGTPFDVPLEVATTTFPLVAPFGTGTTILVEAQLVGVAPAPPLNVTVLDPWGDPKFTPEIVTDTPTGPDVGDKLFIVGVCETVNQNPLLAVPATVTMTFPVVAAIGTGTEMLVAVHDVGVAAMPLNVTVPVVDPRLAPEIVTDAPGTAGLGEIELICGVELGLLKVVETVSNVAVSSVEVLPLVTANPTSTFVAMLIV